MLELNQNIYPPGGRIFTEADGARFKGESWKELIRKVTEYREANKLPVGDVWADIAAQTCARCPTICRETEPFVPPAENTRGQGYGRHDKGVSFNQRVLRWISGILTSKRAGKAGKVPAALAAERAAICAKCPMQRSLNLACTQCMTAMAQARAAALDGKDSKHQNLLPCSVLGEDCQTSVYLDQPGSPDKALPEKCWRRA